MSAIYSKAQKCANMQQLTMYMICSNNNERVVTDLSSLFVSCLFWFGCGFILIVQRVHTPSSAPYQKYLRCFSEQRSTVLQWTAEH